MGHSSLIKQGAVDLPLFTSPFAIIPVQLVDLFVVEVLVYLLEDNLPGAVAVAWLVVVESTFFDVAVASCGDVAPVLGVVVGMVLGDGPVEQLLSMWSELSVVNEAGHGGDGGWSGCAAKVSSGSVSALPAVQGARLLQQAVVEHVGATPVAWRSIGPTCSVAHLATALDILLLSLSDDWQRLILRGQNATPRGQMFLVAHRRLPEIVLVTSASSVPNVC